MVVTRELLFTTAGVRASGTTRNAGAGVRLLLLLGCAEDETESEVPLTFFIWR